MTTKQIGKKNTGASKAAKNGRGLKMRVSQGSVAKVAIHNIELLYKKMGLDPKATKIGKRRLMGTSSVPTQLIEEVAAAADQHGALIGMAFDSDKAREALAYASAFEPVATKAEAFAQRVRDAILAAKSDAGGAALAVYASMKGVVRREEGAALRDSFDKMGKIMKQRRKLGQHRKNVAVAAAAAAAAAAEPAAPPAKPTTTPATTPAPVQSGTKATGGTTVVVNPAALN
jgi:hypothetical protein